MDILFDDKIEIRLKSYFIWTVIIDTFTIESIRTKMNESIEHLHLQSHEDQESKVGNFCTELKCS